MINKLVVEFDVALGNNCVAFMRFDIYNSTVWRLIAIKTLA